MYIRLKSSFEYLNRDFIQLYPSLPLASDLHPGFTLAQEWCDAQIHLKYKHKYYLTFLMLGLYVYQTMRFAWKTLFLIFSIWDDKMIQIMKTFFPFWDKIAIHQILHNFLIREKACVSVCLWKKTFNPIEISYTKHPASSFKSFLRFKTVSLSCFQSMNNIFRFYGYQN